MKIGIANDVAMAAEALRRVVAGSSEHQVPVPASKRCACAPSSARTWC
jgi:hypothetical protein